MCVCVCVRERAVHFGMCFDSDSNTHVAIKCMEKPGIVCYLHIVVVTEKLIVLAYSMH